MAFMSGRHRRDDEDTDINMIPIMNIFLVIIPFLLTSVSFFHISAINTSVPVMADSADNEAKPVEDIKVTVMVEVKSNGLRLSATAEDLEPEQLSQFELTLKSDDAGQYPLFEFNHYLQSIKTAYPASSTLILIPDGEVIYETIIQAMDAARKVDDDPLFPNVVLSGSLG